MLTEGQIKYLATVPDDQRIVIKPFNPRGLEISEEIINSIKEVEPELEVILLGSLALKISGQEDIDISAYCVKAEQPEHLDNFKKLFGEPSRQTANSIGWSFEREGFSVDVWLTDPTSETTKAQRQIFEMLRDSPELLKEYEEIKLEAKDLPYKQYQAKKYEFFNRILDL